MVIERYGNNTRIINSYGVTEVTIDSSYYEKVTNKAIDMSNLPIGKPLANTRFHILNSNMGVQPINVIGELYISGVGVARGYLNKHELTKRKFMDDPFVSGERMYRTGDLARWLPGGNIEFLGRMDNQVKI